MKNLPDRIYLQIESDAEDFNDLKEVTHCVDRINDSDVEYSRVEKGVNEPLGASLVPLDEDELPTAEEFYCNLFSNSRDATNAEKEAMIGFTKIHVQKFAKDHGIFDIPENKTVTNYLTNIK